jgi:hypothetical protein
MIEIRVRRACVAALLALLLIVWSLVQPAPLPVIAAMTVGQLIGTASLGFFLYAIVADLRPELIRLRARMRMRPSTSTPPPPMADAHAEETKPEVPRTGTD